MEILVSVLGNAKCVYSDAIPLSQLGKLSIHRASHVEPNSDGQWLADLSPIEGPVLGPFEKRKDALAAELVWLRDNWLIQSQTIIHR